MSIRLAAATILAVAALSVSAWADTASTPGAKVYFVGLKNGDVVGSTLLVRFGLSGMGIAPAGVEFAGTGHHHLVVDLDTPALNDYLPTNNPKIMHFGKGQTETELKGLTPGQHTLQIIFADQDHKPHTPPIVSERITITVK